MLIYYSLCGYNTYVYIFIVYLTVVTLLWLCNGILEQLTIETDFSVVGHGTRLYIRKNVLYT